MRGLANCLCWYQKAQNSKLIPVSGDLRDESLFSHWLRQTPNRALGRRARSWHSGVDWGSGLSSGGAPFSQLPVCAQLLSCVPLFCDPWTAARQAPLSIGFPRQEFPTSRDFPDPGFKPASLAFPTLAGGFFTTGATWEAPSASCDMKLLSHAQLFATPWIVAYQAPPSIGFSRQEYWSGLPFPSPGDLPNPEIEPWSFTLQADTLPSKPPGKPISFLGWPNTAENSSYWHSRAPNLGPSCLSDYVLHSIFSQASYTQLLSSKQTSPQTICQRWPLLFIHSGVSNSLRPHGPQHARLPCPSLSLRACSNSCPLSQWCHPTTSSSVISSSSCLQSFPASGSFSNESSLHIRWPKYWSFSLSISPSNGYIQDWFPLGLIAGLKSCQTLWLRALPFGSSYISKSPASIKATQGQTHPFHKS